MFIEFGFFYRLLSLPLPRSSFLSLFTSMDTVRIRLCLGTPSSACPTLRSSTLLERVFPTTRKWTYLAMSLNAGRFTLFSVVFHIIFYNQMQELSWEHYSNELEAIEGHLKNVPTNQQNFGQ